MTTISNRNPGFLILACGSLVLAIAMGVRHTFGMFLQPMTLDLGWGRETFSFAIALQNLIWGASQPVFGWMADRYGAGKILLTGGTLYAVGVLGMAYVSSPVDFMLTAGVLIGLGLGASTWSIVYGAVGRSLPPEKHANAFAVVGAAGSFGQFALVPIGQQMLTTIGWSHALLILALVSATMLPLSAGAAERGRELPAAGHGQSTPEALVEAFSHKGFWLLTLGFFACGLQLLFLAVHLPAYLADKGLGPQAGMTALALIGLFNIIGTYVLGRLGGHFHKPYILSAIYFARTVAIAIFVLVPVSSISVAIFGATMGFLWLGTAPLTNGILVTIFGTRYISMLFGLVFLSHQVGGFLGVWLGGKVFDATHSYTLAWVACIAIGLVAAILNIPIEEKPIRTRRLATSPASAL